MSHSCSIDFFDASNNNKNKKLVASNEGFSGWLSVYILKSNHHLKEHW